MMSTNRPLQPQVVLADLRLFLQLLTEAFEAGTMHTREYFDVRGKELKPPLAAMITRSEVGDYLAGRGHVAEELVRENVANLGLRVRVGRYRIFIWRSKDDTIPYPGASRSKRRFLDQPYIQIRLDFPELFPEGDEVHLVVLWNTFPDYQFSGLHLVLPKAPPNEYFEPSAVYWSVPIEHTALTIDGSAPGGADVEQDDDGALGFEIDRSDEEDRDTGETR